MALPVSSVLWVETQTGCGEGAFHHLLSFKRNCFLDWKVTFQVWPGIYHNFSVVCFWIFALNPIITLFKMMHFGKKNVPIKTPECTQQRKYFDYLMMSHILPLSFCYQRPPSVCADFHLGRVLAAVFVCSVSSLLPLGSWIEIFPFSCLWNGSIKQTNVNN